jgi:hypothetical protein
MPTFYFDCEDYAGKFIDDQGQYLPDADAAAREALLAIGDAARDHTRSNFTGRLTILVRDDEGQLFEVSATLEILRMRQ